MSKISIIGLGGITSLGTDVNEIFQKLNENEEINIEYECEYDIPLKLKKNLLRRINRFSHMGMYAATKAIEGIDIDLNDINKERIGTIFSTAYGPMTTNIEFCKQVVKADPDLCSPTLFSNTVANACLGHICIMLGLTGVSTMLMGSNSIGYAAMLMEEKKADYIVTGSVEEYNPGLIENFKNLKELKYPTAECAISILLKRDDDIENNKKYCQIDNFSECNLGINPFRKIAADSKIEKKISRMIKNTISNVNNNKVDAIICSGDPTYINNYEIKAINDIMPECKIVDKVKDVFGETLGSTLDLNIMIAALCLKNGVIPKRITNCKEDIKDPASILVCGYNITGNYTSVLVSR